MNKSRVVDLRPGRPPAKPEVPEPRRRQPATRERRSTLRERKRRYRAVITAAICVGVLLSAYAIHLASYMERFTYRHVSVKGTQQMDAALVQQFSEKMLTISGTGFISGRNILIYTFTPLERMIEAEFPAVKDAKVQRDSSLSNGIVVTISERSAYARWCNESAVQCYKMDDSGTVYGTATAVATSSFTTQYVFTGVLASSTKPTTAPAPLGLVYASGHFPGILSLLRFLGQSGHIALGAQIQNQDDFFVPLSDGFFIKASFGADPNTLARNLELVLASDALRDRRDQIEYVDLRFGNKVYYKLRGQEETK